MSAGKCIIVEKARNRITVLTSDGRFLELPIKRCEYMVGEQVSLAYLSQAPACSWHSWRQVLAGSFKKRLIPVALVASLILFISFFGYAEYLEARPAFAWVTLDLVDSPGSLELEVNDKGLIKSVTCFDEEGKEAITDHDLHMKTVDYAVKALLKTRENDQESEVIIGIIPVKEDSPIDALEKKILKDAEKAAEKAAREAAKRAEKAAKDAAKNHKDAPKGPQPKKNDQPVSTVPKPQTGAAAVNHVRLDNQIRETAKELKISAARAALWALFEEPSERAASQDVKDNSEKSTEPDSPEQGQKDNGNQRQTQPDQGSKPKEPPGQSKDKGNFKDTIPRPGIDKMKNKDSRQEKDHLSKITTKWVDDVKKAKSPKHKQAKDKNPKAKGTQGNNNRGGK